jgi:succinylglutamate desuccinylase
VNQGVPMVIPTTVNVYRAIEAIDYPRNGHGELTAMIHPDRQNRDYQLIVPGDPLFLDLQGNTIYYQGNQPVFPVFINESAYYEKGVAMVLTEQQNTKVAF